MNKKELKKAFAEGLITKEKFQEELFKIETTPRVKKRKKLPVAIEEDEFVKLIQNTKYPHWKVAFLFGFAAGLRISEVIKLKKENIDFEKGQIFIQDAKGGKDRIVPIPKGLKPKHLKHIPMKCGARALQAAFSKCAKLAGLMETKPELHFHSLRHGFASKCAAGGMPLPYLRDLLGHENISTTNIYLRMNPKDAIKSYMDNF